jgi:hypothetical protein
MNPLRVKMERNVLILCGYYKGHFLAVSFMRGVFGA